MAVVAPAAPMSHLPSLPGTRWVTTDEQGVPTWTMVNPGLSRRRRRVAALAHAPRHPRVRQRQIIAPSVGVIAVGAIAGWGLADLFGTDYVPGWLIIGFLVSIAAAAAGLSLLTRWRQGLAQAQHVVQVTGPHARALVDIETAITGWNAQCRHADAKLSAPELLWHAALHPRPAIATAKTLSILPPEEEIRALDRLHTLGQDSRSPGNVTTLQGIVRGVDRP